MLKEILMFLNYKIFWEIMEEFMIKKKLFENVLSFILKEVKVNNLI